MTTERDRRKARMQAATARRADEDAPAAGVTAIRSKPVRITVDLYPEDYRLLSAWTTRAATELDVPRVTAADAVRAMVRVVALDETFGLVVLDMIRRGKEGR
jgi:hypothetical protein